MEKKKWCIFCRLSMFQNQLFGNFTVTACTWSYCTIMTYKLEYSYFHPVSSCHRVIPSRKISLNFNREISYWELAQRPLPLLSYFNEIKQASKTCKNIMSQTFEVFLFIIFWCPVSWELCRSQGFIYRSLLDTSRSANSAVTIPSHHQYTT